MHHDVDGSTSTHLSQAALSNKNHPTLIGKDKNRISPHVLPYISHDPVVQFSFIYQSYLSSTIYVLEKEVSTFVSQRKSKMAAIDLPIIDISNPHNPSVGKAMLDAAAKYGFLYVASQSTDFSADDVERAFGLVCTLDLIDTSITNCSQSKEFFTSPVEEKATCRITPNVRPLVT